VHQQAATTLLSPPVLCSSRQQAVSLHFDPSLYIFFFTRSSNLTRATNPHQLLQPRCFLSLPRLFFAPRKLQSNSLQLFSPPNCSLNLLPSTRSSKPSFLLCPSPLPCPQINRCPLLHRSAAGRPLSAPVCTCGWESTEIGCHPYPGAATRGPFAMLAPPTRSPTCREPAQQCAAMGRVPLWHLIERSACKTEEPLLCPQPTR
jgi:hypothetical protein